MLKDQETLLEYNRLKAEYFTTLRSCSGHGTRGQVYVDNAWNALKHFVDKHPYYKLPAKQTVSNDGIGTGVAVATQSCAQQ